MPLEQKLKSTKERIYIRTPTHPLPPHLNSDGECCDLICITRSINDRSNEQQPKDSRLRQHPRIPPIKRFSSLQLSENPNIGGATSTHGSSDRIGARLVRAISKITLVDSGAEYILRLYSKTLV